MKRDGKLLMHDREKNTFEDLSVPGGDDIREVTFANERDLILTESEISGGRGLVRLNANGTVDVLSAERGSYRQPFVDRIRNRILVHRHDNPTSLRLVRWP